jgi:peptidoglycan/LPS O-acetylase OafA/YrhL
MHPAFRVPYLVAGALWTGVDLFFVLSGFLITGILLRTREQPHGLRTFYIRRTLRIFPPYYLVLASLFCLLLVIEGIDAVLMSERLSYWAYLQNFFVAMKSWDDFRFLAHLWSLAVEEQFYLFWPLVILLLPLRHLGWITACLVVMPLLLRAAMLMAGSYYIAVYVLIFARMDALAVGALMALLAVTVEGRGMLARLGPKLLVGGVLVMGCIAVWCKGYDLDHAVVQTLGYSANLVAAAGLISMLCFGGNAHRTTAFFSMAVLTWVGRRSYMGYLLHWPVALQVHHHLVKWDVEPMAGLIINLVAMAVVTLIGAELSWRFYERGWLRLRSRYAPSPAT